MGKIWLPFGKDEEFRNTYINLPNMTSEQIDTWANQQSSVTNSEVYQTAMNNKKFGMALGIIGSVVTFGVGLGATVLVKRIAKKYSNKKSNK